MACTSPLFRIPVSCPSFRLLPESDKKRVKNDGVFYFDLLAVNTLKDIKGFNMDDVQRLRCGQCIDCRLAYSRDWAVRCSLEASQHEHNYFVTLTYDNNSLPTGEFVDYTGEVKDTNLCRRHVQLFLKNLREWERITNNNTGIKVFYCGEYGGLTDRPHYHLCLFGVSEIPDLTYFCKRGNYKYYKSVLYERFWSDSSTGALRGFVDICAVSFDTIAYTARYCLKKQQGKMKNYFLDYYDSLDVLKRPDLRVQPFIGMSRRPGIASEYYEQNKKQIREEDLVKYQKKFELFTSKPPRYFDKLFEREDPDAFAVLKANRKRVGLEVSKAKKSLYSESEVDRLAREESMLKDREKKYYVRNL